MDAHTELGATDPVPHGIIEDADGVTDIVLKAMERADSPRLRQVMESFVRHLHAFAREVRVSEQEYELGVSMLNRIGQSTNDTHNEGMMFADAVGFSTLVCMLNAGRNGATETAAALLGPFWRDNPPATANGGSVVRSDTPGPALLVDCRITDPSGAPLAGVEVDTWQSSPTGYYENQDPAQANMNLRGRFTTGPDGRFTFRSVKPAGYPVPTHGPTGDMLRAQHRHPFRPAHLHVMAFKPGYRTLITQVFVDDDRHLESDVVFGVTRDLIGKYHRHDEPAPDVAPPWYSLDYAFVMEPGEAVRPQPPIK